jgi:hypothetical protein|tara:strand:- start:283 stop:399 length:117 start_codon:yes stop_codon:yes gene_type:complete
MMTDGKLISLFLFGATVGFIGGLLTGIVLYNAYFGSAL